MKFRVLLFLLSFLFVIQAQAASKPTVAEAEQFMNQAEARLNEIEVKAARASWVQENFITDDTQALSADAQDQLTAATTELIEQSKRFDGLSLPPELSRKFMLLRLSLTAPAPKDPALRKEMTQIAASLDADYGKGKYCRKPDDCLDITAIERIMGDSRDPNELKDVWVGWHKVGAPMRQRYARFVQLSNQGAEELGFKDTGALWRAGYDMTPDQFSAEVERLWQQVRPLYLSLHTYVRARLVQKYGPQVVPPDGPIPAHLLGNPWAQEWGNVFPILGLDEKSRGYDLTALLQAKNLDAKGMVRYGEGFYKSLGFAPLPDTFWVRSLLTKPRDRDVVCHASAWDIDNFDDLRVKMCIQIRDVDFVTIHHELGHNMYQRAYENQPFLFKNGANDGFHEAIGDTIALAITPEYLKTIGLLGKVPSAESDIPILLNQALDKVAFLPFGLMIDQWRWKVFSGEITPARLRQGLVGSSIEISRRRAAGRTQRGRFRSRCKISRARQCAVHAVLPRADSAVPVLSRLVPGVGIHRPTQSLHLLWLERSRREIQQDAGDGPEQAVARRIGSADRTAPDGRNCVTGLFRPTPKMAG